jgi:hypothetical protein
MDDERIYSLQVFLLRDRKVPITVTYTSTSKVLHLKSQIQHQLNIPIEQQKLLFGAVELQNDRIVMTYQLQYQTTLFLVLQQTSSSLVEYDTLHTNFVRSSPSPIPSTSLTDIPLHYGEGNEDIQNIEMYVWCHKYEHIPLVVGEDEDPLPHQVFSLSSERERRSYIYIYKVKKVKILLIKRMKMYIK